MKKFTSMIVALLFAVTLFARVPAQKAARTLQFTPATGQVLKNAGKIEAGRTISENQLQASRRAASDYVIISEQPEGDLKTFKREGGHYFVQNQQIYYGDQSGTIDIVFGADNKVFFKDLVSGLATGAWVEGTLSEDGSLITVALNQNVYYHSQYDACIAICLINYDPTNGFVVDTETKEVTFAVADGVISLQGTGFTSVSLGGVWTDDGTLQDYGDYASVYTPYEPNVTLVELPEGAEVQELPIIGTFFASLSDYQSDNGQALSGNVKVARVGDDFYFQGLVPSMPEAWIKGSLNEDGEIELPITYLGEGENGPVYAMGYSSSGVAPCYLIFDENLNSFEVDGYLILSSSELENTLDAIITPLHIGALPAVVELPEGLEPVEMPMTGTYYDGQDESAINGTVNVAIDEEGNVFIQGLISEMPEAWIQGKFNEDRTQVIFHAGQFIGFGEYGSLFLVSAEENENSETIITDVVFDYDANRNVFTSVNEIFANGKANELYYLSSLSDVVIGTNCDAIWIAAQQNYANQEEVAEIEISETIHGSLALGENANGNTPKYYTLGEAVRLYAGNTLTITSEQLMGKIIITMTGTEKQMSLEANVGEYALDGSDGIWTGMANEVVFSVPNVSGTQARIVKIQIFYFDYGTTLVELPENLETIPYSFKGTDTWLEKEDSHEVLVAFDGNDVYIQGLSVYATDGWVKGTLQEDGTLEIPGWALGEYASYFGSINLTFGGATFHYDSENDVFTCDEYTSLDEDGNLWDEFADITLTRINEVAATPVNPVINSFNGTSTYPSIAFTITLEDADGNALLSGKTSYVLFIEKDGQVSELTLTADLYENLTQDMTEIPYTFSDEWDIYPTRVYLNQGEEELRSWTKIGIQVIYRGGGEEHRSEIVWFDLSEYWAANPVTALNSVSADVIETIYYDVLGRRIDANTTGIQIQKVRYSDGTTRTIKVLNRAK